MPTQRIQMGFIVAIPIPSIAQDGQKISDRRVRRWKERALSLLGDCFGGSIATRSPGPYVHQDGTVVFDRNQWVVQAGCSHREDYLKQRDQIEEFAEQMGTALNQEAVFVLASSYGESVLLLLTDDGDST